MATEAHTTFAAASSYAELSSVLERARTDLAHPAPITDVHLLGLQHRWSTALSARLDEAIEVASSGKEREAVAAAWHTLAHDLDVLRTVLDRHQATSPALIDAQGAEFRMLALAAGLASLDTPTSTAVDLGRLFYASIRTRTEGGEIRARRHRREAARCGSSLVAAEHERGAGQRHGVRVAASGNPAGPGGHPSAARTTGGCWVTAWRTRYRSCHAG